MKYKKKELMNDFWLFSLENTTYEPQAYLISGIKKPNNMVVLRF